MDQAVALVEAYLRVNGYFTVTEYPIIESCRFGGYRTATDLDVVAFGFQEQGVSFRCPERVADRGGAGLYAPHPHLGAFGNEADMLIGEVKEGRAELNEATRDPAVLRAALTRFGCCEPQHASSVVQDLLQQGTCPNAL
jgi:hypothetical protein